MSMTKWCRRWRWFLPGLLVLVVAIHGCGDDSPTGPGDPPAPVTFADIGPAGGEVAIVAGDSTVYTLKVPFAALSHVTRIGLRLRTSIPDVYGLGAMAAGVTLEPQGLTFNIPATLSIGLRTTWSGERAPAILHTADDGTPMLLETDATPLMLSAPIEHFSGATPVSPTTASIVLLWDSIVLEIDTYGVDVARVRSLASIYVHVLRNSATYPSIDLGAWLAELWAQTNDLIILGTMRCDAGAYNDGEIILRAARNLASFLFFADLEDEARTAPLNRCIAGGSCPDNRCDVTGYGEPELYFSSGEIYERQRCGTVIERALNGTDGGSGSLGYGSARAWAFHDVTGQTHGGYGTHVEWDDILIVTPSDPLLIGTWGYFTARVQIEVSGAADTRDGSTKPALAIAEAYSIWLKIQGGDTLDVESRIQDGSAGPVNQTHDVRYEFRFGEPRYLNLVTRATATWIGSIDGEANGAARAEASSRWLGITGVFTEAGAPVAAYTICARSGADYTAAASVR